MLPVRDPAALRRIQTCWMMMMMRSFTGLNQESADFDLELMDDLDMGFRDREVQPPNEARRINEELKMRKVSVLQ
jgi:hypothetical protein